MNLIFVAVTFINIHLASGAVDPESHSLEALRNDEIEQIFLVAEMAQLREEIPIVIGDLNAAPNLCSSNYRSFRLRKWRDAFIYGLRYKTLSNYQFVRGLESSDAPLSDHTLATHQDRSVKSKESQVSKVLSLMRENNHKHQQPQHQQPQHQQPQHQQPQHQQPQHQQPQQQQPQHQQQVSDEGPLSLCSVRKIATFSSGGASTEASVASPFEGGKLLQASSFLLSNINSPSIDTYLDSNEILPTVDNLLGSESDEQLSLLPDRYQDVRLQPVSKKNSNYMVIPTLNGRRISDEAPSDSQLDMPPSREPLMKFPRGNNDEVYNCRLAKSRCKRKKLMIPRNPRSDKFELMANTRVKSKLNSSRTSHRRSLCLGQPFKNDGNIVVGKVTKLMKHAGKVLGVDKLGSTYIDMTHDHDDPYATQSFTWDPHNPLNAIGPHSECHGLRCDHVFLPPLSDSRGLANFVPVHASVVFTEPQVTVQGICCGLLSQPSLVTLSDHYAIRIELQRTNFPVVLQILEELAPDP